MKPRVLIPALVALAIMAGAAGLILWQKQHQRLGEPGLRTTPIAGSDRLRLELPERVGTFVSTNLEPSAEELAMLPKDTSFGRRIYVDATGFQVALSAVMMGTDRTSIHKPEFCLPGQGWQITHSIPTTVPIARPHRYELPVMKLLATGTFAGPGGQAVTRQGVYVYWFVAKDRLTSSHWDRVTWLALDLLRTGTLQRWAYVTFFATCAPGEQDATFQRLSELIAAAVPEFQTVTRPAVDPAPGSTAQRPGGP